jgi:phage protein D
MNQVRRPRLAASVNGIPIQGLISAQVASTNYQGADHFSLSVALSAESKLAANYWMSESRLDIQIQAQADTIDPLITLLQGTVDTIRMDSQRNVLVAEGRDESAALIDSRTFQTFTNQTSSEIAAAIAVKYNLSASITKTTGIIGRSDEDGHDLTVLGRFSRLISDWDVLAYLATREGFEFSIQSRTLIFRPVAAVVTGKYVLHPRDLTRLVLSRSVTSDQPQELVVQSWDHYEQMVVSGRAANMQAGESGSARHVLLAAPRMGSQELDALSRHYLSEMAANGKIIEFQMPGQCGMMARDQVIMTGTNTNFDRTYNIETIRRSFNPTLGFTQWVRAKATVDLTPSVQSE